MSPGDEDIELPDPGDPTTPFPFELPSADWPEAPPRDLAAFRRWCESRDSDLRRLPPSLGFYASVFAGKAVHDAWLFATSFGIQVPMPPRLMAPHSALEFLAVCMGRCAEQIRPANPASQQPPQGARPRWDGETRTLYLGDRSIKLYNRGTAVNQIDVIEAFHNAGWPDVIDDPFKNSRKLNQTLRSLRDSLPAKTIKFRGDGTGERVRWEYAT